MHEATDSRPPRRPLRWWPAIVILVVVAGLLFTIHHIIVLGASFGDTRVVVLASLGVWAGATVWSWIYLRWRNIYAAYVSHVFADLILFWIGYQLIFG